MASKLSYPTLGRHLLDAMPELEERYDFLIREWEGETPGPHVIFGDALNPLLLDLLGSNEAVAIHEMLLRRVFGFLELLARHPDPRVQQVVSTTVCERLGDDPRVLARARPFMGERTRELSREIEEFWSNGKQALTPNRPEPVTAFRQGDR
jgi:hypothetical protein